MSCTHEVWEMDTAAHMDGLCPLCLAERVRMIRAATIEECLQICSDYTGHDGFSIADAITDRIRALKEPVQPRADDGNSYRYHATGLPAGGDKEQP